MVNILKILKKMHDFDESALSNLSFMLYFLGV